MCITLGHTHYGGCSVIQRLWLVSASLHFDKQVDSKSHTAHTKGIFILLQSSQTIQNTTSEN
jgi:hypothetical protein